MNIKPKVNGTKVVTGKIRLSYANISSPGLQQKGKSPSTPLVSLSLNLTQRPSQPSTKQ